jgi:hypothetical protein
MTEKGSSSLIRQKMLIELLMAITDKDGPFVNLSVNKD